MNASSVKPGFYRHFRTNQLYYYLGSASQVSYGSREIDWMGLLFTNSECIEWHAELGVIAGTNSYVFRTANKDWQMPGDWAAYFAPEHKAWLRPHGMFFDRVDGSTKRFARLGGSMAIAPF